MSQPSSLLLRQQNSQQRSPPRRPRRRPPPLQPQRPPSVLLTIQRSSQRLTCHRSNRLTYQPQSSQRNGLQLRPPLPSQQSILTPQCPLPRPRQAPLIPHTPQ